MSLKSLLSGLNGVFAANRDKHEAHRRAVPLLEDAAGRPAVVTDILRAHILKPGNLNRGHYPVLAFDIELNPFYALSLNAWVALPDGNTDLSTKAIHHHGDMLLSSASLFGPGYEHWTFTPPERQEGRGLFRMRLAERAVHAKGKVAFVDHHVPHCPFYPGALSLTLALWSSREPATWKDRLKRLPPFKGREAFFRGLAVGAGLTNALSIKVVRDFDFSPVPGGFSSMEERVEFSLGPNEDYLQNFVHLAQGTGNESLLEELDRACAAGRVDNPSALGRFVSEARRGRPVPGKLAPFHTNVPGFNFSRADVERSLSR